VRETNKVKIVMRLPPKVLHPNSRPHYFAKAKAARTYREIAKLNALIVRPSTPWATATVQCTFYFATTRRRDGDNWLASMKAAFDGLADGHVVANDAGFTHLPPKMQIDRAHPRVEIEVWPA
jgi:Holliday junction resolvase RusA-like endonuclease